MDELDFDGKKYISSKRAATLTGYAKDYVGQLCREGRVDARLVGRSWYVYEESILKHRFKDDAEGATHHAIEEENIEVSKEANNEVSNLVEPSEITNKQATWEQATYTPEIVEEVIPMPEALKKSNESTEVQHPDLTDMQDAWKSWFEESHPEPIKNVLDKENIEEEEKGTAVPMHTPQKNVEPQSVHIDIDIPSQIREEPMIPTFQQQSIPERTYSERTYTENTNVKETSYLALKALCVAIVIICSSLTFVALGFGQTENIYRGISILESLSGETVVK